MLRACDLVAYLNEETLTDVVTAAEVQDAATVAKVQGAATDAARRCNCCWRYTKDAACMRPRNLIERGCVAGRCDCRWQTLQVLLKHRTLQVLLKYRALQLMLPDVATAAGATR